MPDRFYQIPPQPWEHFPEQIASPLCRRWLVGKQVVALQVVYQRTPREKGEERRKARGSADNDSPLNPSQLAASLCPSHSRLRPPAGGAWRSPPASWGPDAASGVAWRWEHRSSLWTAALAKSGKTRGCWWATVEWERGVCCRPLKRLQKGEGSKI